MFVVESLSAEVRESGAYAGLPTTAIVEDTPLRWLLTEFPLPQGMWRHAIQTGVDGVLGDFGSFTIDEVESFARREGHIIAGEARVQLATTNETPFVHLHAHSEYSPLDGLATITEMVERVAQQGQSAMAVTDHGVCAGHLELQSVARKVGIKPIFGVEANFIANAKDKNPELRGAYNHFILLAKNKVGLHNLWRASTMAHTPERFYGRSRMDWALLEEYGEGLIASSACLRGPLSNMILDGDEQGTIEMISRFKGIFGDDFYLELHLNQLEDQKKINEALVSLGQSTSTPLIVVGDSHYSCEEHAHAHTVWIAAQTNKDLQDEADLFAGHEEYHLHTVEDARRSLSYLSPDAVESAIAMTQTIADMCDATIDPRGSTPVYHRYEQKDQPVQGAELDAMVLDEVCRSAMHDRFPAEVWEDAELKAKYLTRYEEEMESLRGKGFCGYMLIVWDYCNWCREQGILMGPGRGSAAGSLVTYLLSITQPDPIPPGLLFERFISPGRTELPDIDSDFPKSKRSEVTNYLVERWGQDHVVRVGTVTRLRNKGVINDVARVLKGSEHEVDFMDQKKITTLIDTAEASTAGLGLPWDELWEQEADQLEPWKLKYPELFKYAEILVGRLKSYGKHPAGVVIDPQHSIIDAIPLRQGEDDHPVSEFPMESLDELGLVKFDILTVRTLDTIQECMDLIESNPKYAGKVPHPHKWRDEYDDPEVWDMICEGDTLGIFQLETPTCSRLSARILPRSLADLCAILTLVRPGPMRSGLTDSFIRRRDGQEPVTFAHPLLRDVLGDTYGTMIYQEDIMATVKVIAGYDSAEADQVRKILGKKKVDKVAAEGERFISRSVEMGIDRQLAEHMFRQMEEFARYSFNKSHSWAYAMLAFWCAWYKCHFPAEFLVAALSTADKDRFPDFVMDARRKGYRIEMPDINESGETFTVTSDGMGVRYGLSSIKGLGNVAARAAISERPYTSVLDFVERRPTKCNFGAIKLLSSIGVLDSLEPDHHRAQIDDYVEQMATGKLEQCAHMRTGTTANQGVDVCCGFDWENEPVVLGKSGKPLKSKPIPKKCTKACRQYVAAPSVRWKDIPPLSDKEIRRREAEVIGLYVSSTPFDGHDLTGLADYDALTHGENGYHSTIAEIRSIRKLTDKSGREMAFLSVLLPGGEASFTVFNSTYKELGEHLRPGVVGIFSVDKNSRGISVDRFIPTTL